MALCHGYTLWTDRTASRTVPYMECTIERPKFSRKSAVQRYHFRRVFLGCSGHTRISGRTAKIALQPTLESSYVGRYLFAAADAEPRTRSEMVHTPPEISEWAPRTMSKGR